MKIVMSGYYGFDNVGDEAILYAIIQALRENQPDVEITVLSNNPEKTKAVYGVHAVNRWKLGEVLSALRNSDGLLSGGGSLLQDATGFKSVPYYTGIMKMAQLLGKPVFIYAQGMGPINRLINKKIMKSVLKNTVITVRDEASKKLLQDEIGLKNPIELVPDPVLGLQVESLHHAWWEEQAFSGRVLTVSVRDWPSDVDFKSKIAKALDLVVESGIHVVFVPMHGEHDDVTSREVAKMMTGKAYISPYGDSIEEKIALIGQSDLLVGMRLHALIFAAVTNTPFIALSYDPKIDAFAHICQQQVAGHVNESNWSESDLFEDIQRVLNTLEDEVKKLTQKAEPLRNQAIETAAQALNVFAKKA